MNLKHAIQIIKKAPQSEALNLRLSIAFIISYYSIRSPLKYVIIDCNSLFRASSGSISKIIAC